jgi:hypothetical protein
LWAGLTVHIADYPAQNAIGLVCQRPAKAPTDDHRAILNRFPARRRVHL